MLNKGHKGQGTWDISGKGISDKGVVNHDFFIFVLFIFCILVVFFLFFHLPNIYLSLVITSLLSVLLQLCWSILPLQVFSKNQVGESCKQGIQAVCSTPIHYVK